MDNRNKNEISSRLQIPSHFSGCLRGTISTPDPNRFNQMEIWMTFSRVGYLAISGSIHYLGSFDPDNALFFFKYHIGFLFGSYLLLFSRSKNKIIYVIVSK